LNGNALSKEVAQDLSCIVVVLADIFQLSDTVSQDFRLFLGVMHALLPQQSLFLVRFDLGLGPSPLHPDLEHVGADAFMSYMEKKMISYGKPPQRNKT
jgi:hypothetical protein